MRSYLFALLLVVAAGPAGAEPRPMTSKVWEDVSPDRVLPAANTNKIFLNRCLGNCIVSPGTTDSRIDRSSIVSAQRSLSPFNYGDTTWNSIVSCVKDVFTPFGVEITTTDPGTANHFEIMIAGTPQQFYGDSLHNGVGGVSPFNCSVPYIPNSLVFVFNIWGNNPDQICSVAAQEIAHSFGLDHVTESSDPLTYFNYSSRRHFKDAQVQCGSDCFDFDNNGTTPNTTQPTGGYTCTGTTLNMGAQNHPCSCAGLDPAIMLNTQNSVAVIKNLFGAGTPVPPTLTITTPREGDNVAPGFAVAAEATDDNGIGMVELRVDGMMAGTATQFPYVFNAPTTLGDGAHTVEVTAYDKYGASTVKAVQVYIGAPCKKPADCSKSTDTCVGGRCVPGPGVQGGLGTACTDNTMCASGQCASDSTGAMYCVEICDPTADQCPGGFTCLEVGTGGVCWPSDDGSGCCETGNAGAGWTGMGLFVAALLWCHRRPRPAFYRRRRS